MSKALNLEGKPTMKFPLLPLVCKLIYSITLMNYCIGRWRDTLDLIHDCRCAFILDLASLYGIQALQRITMEYVGWALRAMGLWQCKALIATPWSSSTPPLSYLCPRYSEMMMHLDHVSQPTTHCTQHLEDNLGLRGGYVFPRETWEDTCHLLALIDGILTWY